MDVTVDAVVVTPRVVIINGCFATHHNGNTFEGRWLHVWATNGDGQILGDGRADVFWNEYPYGPTGGPAT